MQVGVSVSFILGPLLVRSGPDVTVDEMRHDVGQACEETGTGLGTGDWAETHIACGKCESDGLGSGRPERQWRLASELETHRGVFGR